MPSVRKDDGFRRENGLRKPPMSAAAMKELKTGDAWVGALALGILGARFFGPVGLFIGAAIGAIGAYAVKREP